MSRLASLLTCHPSAPEWRMICAIAHDAIAKAAQHGEERLTFRGYCVDALRLGTAGEEQATLIDLTLSAVGGARVFERVRIEVARGPHFDSACVIVQIPAEHRRAAPERVSRWLCQPE